MSDDTQQVDPDAYYGDQDINSGELDLSFLDEDEAAESDSTAGSNSDDTDQKT